MFTLSQVFQIISLVQVKKMFMKYWLETVSFRFLCFSETLMIFCKKFFKLNFIALFLQNWIFRSIICIVKIKKTNVSNREIQLVCSALNFIIIYITLQLLPFRIDQIYCLYNSSAGNEIVKHKNDKNIFRFFFRSN